jgi:adenylosuccinate synthase
MTKADVLDTLDVLKICTEYSVDGKETNKVPFQMEGISVDPVYKEFEGWKSDITKVKEFQNIPQKMAGYIDYINKYLGVDVKFISNGPGTEQLIVAS